MDTNPPPATRPFDGPTRYVPDARAHFARLRTAAEQYPDAVKAEVGLDWMRRKPYDSRATHPQFFACMHAAMNVLQAMQLPSGALVVEVGAGPGWLTQILVGLGYRVLAIEPSAAMIDMARARVDGFAATIGAPSDTATFWATTLEEADLTPYQGQADAVWFHEVMHHVIDEHASLRQVMGLLRPGGCLAVSGDSRWHPGDRGLEDVLDTEMNQYGTLESPFTQEYMRHVLVEAGFVDIVFYHAVNGLFPETEGARTIGEVANPSAAALNTVLAWRAIVPGVGNVLRLTTAPDRTAAAFTLLRAEWDGDTLAVEVRIANSGETYWPMHQPGLMGGLTLALTQDGTGGLANEAANRVPLGKPLLPGDEVTIDGRFDAAGLDRTGVWLRLVAEGAFWLPGGLLVRA